VVFELLRALPVRRQPRALLPNRRQPRPADSESSDDRDQLADNLYLDQRFRPEVEPDSASLGPGLVYRFGVGATLEFICIDTSIASGMDIEHYFDDPAHIRWVSRALDGSRAR
jgi:tartrate-resistant acid phosphatase type 5